MQLCFPVQAPLSKPTPWGWHADRQTRGRQSWGQKRCSHWTGILTAVPLPTPLITLFYRAGSESGLEVVASVACSSGWQLPWAEGEESHGEQQRRAFHFGEVSAPDSLSAAS